MKQHKQLSLEMRAATDAVASSPAARVSPAMGASSGGSPPRVAEFFAGIGLVRAALERVGFHVAWANDIEPSKLAMYAANFSADHFVLGDVSDVHGDDLPEVEIATASFPCTDLSLAGNRAGLAGVQSSMFWEFARILDEMEDRKPFAVLLENVPSFATSNGGADFRAAIARLNDLGYLCDVLVLDAKWFVPQSRPRLFVVGSQEPIEYEDETASSSMLRPPWIQQFVNRFGELELQAAPLPTPDPVINDLSTIVQRLRPNDARWWDEERTERFVHSLSSVQLARLDAMQAFHRRTWATAYRRTRGSRAVWEIRGDAISGCLRTARGGSSKQAIVEAGRSELRVRWMTPREYARLQGAPEYRFGPVSDNQVLFGFGDAVCVPVIEWLARHYLWPLVARELTGERMLVGAA